MMVFSLRRFVLFPLVLRLETNRMQLLFPSLSLSPSNDDAVVYRERVDGQHVLFFCCRCSFVHIVDHLKLLVIARAQDEIELPIILSCYIARICP